MAEAKRRPLVIDFSDCSGGCNNVEYPTEFFRNQVSADSIGFTLRKSGLKKQPGSTGLSAVTTFANYLRGMFSHRTFAGTERLYGVSAGVLSQISTSDGSLTSKYTVGSVNNRAWACDSSGKKFVCNGNSVIKLEDNTAYQVGITAPSGASAAAAAGGSLASGDYTVYVSYARKVSGTNVLYSAGESLGTITLSGGNNSITITFPDSDDSQVNNKVVWILSPDELVHYFFHETDDNSTTSITISSSTSKDTAIIYEYSAADNGLPPAITYIYAFAGRLWGIIDNIIYYSNEGSYSVYDLEKWAAANYRETPYKITGIFSVGLHLFFNTTVGIVILPYGDINQKEILIEKRWYFYDMNTVAPWNAGVIGLTNQGVRLFDGERFTSFNFGYPIQEKIDEIYSHDTNFPPCGFVYRKKFRDEYHLMWQDPSVSVTVNNIHAVLNLSSAIWESFNAYNLSWEFQQTSGHYGVVFNNNTLYIGQSHAYASKVYYEDSSTSRVNNCYDREGVLIASATDKQSYLKSREHMENVAAMMRVDKIYCHAQNEKAFEIRICAGEKTKKKTDWLTINTSGGAPVTFPAGFPVVWASDFADVTKKGLPNSFWCRSVYAEIRQTADDTNLKILKLALFCEVEMNRST